MSPQQAELNYHQLIQSQELCEALFNNPSFITNVHHTSNALSIPDTDAQQELYLSVLNRLKTHSQQTELLKLIDNRDSHVEWLITYARMDLTRRQLNQTNAYYANNEELTDSLIEELSDEVNVTDLPRQQANAIDTIKASGFTNQRINFAILLMGMGAEATKDVLSLTDKQFNERVQKFIKYCEHHRHELDRTIIQHKLDSINNGIKMLAPVMNLVEDMDMPEQLITEYLRDNFNYFDEYIGLIGAPYITQPVSLLRDFGSAPIKDQYNFINHVYKDIERLRARHNKLLNEINEVIKVA